MKILVVILMQLLLLNCNSLIAQSLTPFVVSTSGGFYANGNAQLSFTAGEMTMVQTFASANSILTQGFQQPWDFGVYITEHPTDNFSYVVFPNPSNGNFSLFADLLQATKTVIKIIDVTGRVVLINDLELDAGKNKFNFDLTSEAEGIYFLQIITTENPNQDTYFFKIQIIK